jgi:hypothetical protein
MKDRRRAAVVGLCLTGSGAAAAMNLVPSLALLFWCVGFGAAVAALMLLQGKPQE